MIDFSTIKEITINEGSVVKITDSLGVVYWQKQTQKPCYYVAETFSDLPSNPTLDMGYVKNESVWYMVSKSTSGGSTKSWEKYGIISEVSTLSIFAYEGKLVWLSTDNHEYQWTNGAWVDLGEIKDEAIKLPDGYTELTYIKNTSNAYIDTGVSGGTQPKFRIDFSNPSQSINYSQNFAGDRSAGFCKIFNEPQNPLTGKLRFASNSGNINPTLAYDERAVFELDYNDKTLYKNGVSVGKYSLLDNSWGNLTYWVFNAHEEPTLYASMTLYSLRMWSEGAMVRDFIPCKNAEGIVGLYDGVEGKFYNSLGGTFVAGSTGSSQGRIVYPATYEEIDAPYLNTTTVATIAERNSLDCPYVGMSVKVLADGKKYKFNESYEWEELKYSIDIDLNSQWVASTKQVSGYDVYMSNSNKGVNSSYASMKFIFKGVPDFKIYINSYAESNYDYTVAWNLDVDFPTINPSYSSTGVKAHTKGNQKDPTSISNFTEVDYSNDGGEHFVVVTYRKDTISNVNDDRGYVAIKQ